MWIVEDLLYCIFGMVASLTAKFCLFYMSYVYEKLNRYMITLNNILVLI